MSPTTRLGQHLTQGVAIACVLGLVVAGALWWALKDAGTRTVTAYFPTTTGLYEGNSVRVQGVDIGSVTGVEPVGDKVRVTVEYDRTVRVPADADAIIVAPSLVSDRYVQFTPIYSGGPEMGDGAIIPLERTAVPLEIDDLYASLARVSKALGPDGANRDGSLSNMLDTLAANFEGNGKALNNAINKLGDAAGTLSGHKENLFGTVTNLAEFSTTLAASDSDVRRFEENLADVSGFLAGERQNLAATVKQLSTTLGSVHKFIRDNKDRLRSNVDKLASVSGVLVDQRAALAEIFDVAPVALNNVLNTYNATSQSLDSRPNLNELTQPPIMMICGYLQGLPDQLDALADLCRELAPLGDDLPSVGDVIESLQAGSMPDLPLPLAEAMYGPRVSGGGR